MHGHRALALAAISITALIVPSALAAAGASPPGTSDPPAGMAQCRNGAWRTLTDGQGQRFTNQGQCVAWMIHHPVGPGDLTGSFAARGPVTFSRCSLILQVLDASYADGGAAGTIQLHLEFCLSLAGNTPTGALYDIVAGTFRFATAVGEASGTPSGTAFSSAATATVDYDATLTITTGSGAFAGTTGTLHAVITGCFFAALLAGPPFRVECPSGSITA